MSMRLKMKSVINGIHINKIDFSDVRQLEFENWKNHEIYKEVKDFDKKCIFTKNGFIQSTK